MVILLPICIVYHNKSLNQKIVIKLPVKIEPPPKFCNWISFRICSVCSYVESTHSISSFNKFSICISSIIEWSAPVSLGITKKYTILIIDELQELLQIYINVGMYV